MTDRDDSRTMQSAVREAWEQTTPLRLTGSGSKDFYGRQTQAERVLELASHRGIVDYQPTELVITARAGTPLAEIEETLHAQGQMLPFEPPYFGGHGTLGGAIASGLSGPRRPWGGSPRDLLLGVKILDGRGRILNFGGQVMKNVAGYDISRLMAGALGTLGILLEVSVKVLPRPAEETTIRFNRPAEAFQTLLTRMLNEDMPITATYRYADDCGLRLGCGQQRVKQILSRYGITPEASLAESFWSDLRDHKHAFFNHDAPLWRVAVPPTARVDFSQPMLCEWAGGQRWMFSQSPADEIREHVSRLGGHATQFRGGDRTGQVFHPLHPRIADLQTGLKRVFDPRGILNPGRLYAED
ncbi:MAG: glycolate oxidase subunit GlcE [Candidatus Thiodiazotropha sp.]